MPCQCYSSQQMPCFSDAIVLCIDSSCSLLAAALPVQMPAPSGKCQLSKAVVQGAYKELQKSRETAARLEKELEELKNSRVQLLPPSAWIKREQKYKMDLERYEHTIGMQQQRLEKLEDEVKVLQAGANIKPLEEKIMVSKGFNNWT